jgi:site-specific DNA recombinase
MTARLLNVCYSPHQEADSRPQAAARQTARYGHLLDKGVLYRLLNNRVYIGEAVHKGISYPGEHEAIVDRKHWDQAHAILRESPRKRAVSTRAQTPALLKGLLFGPDGAAMSPTHTRKKVTMRGRPQAR